MKTWFDISENSFNEFCTTSDKKIRSNITNNAFSLRSCYCQSKTRILCELLYQILDFCARENLSYQAVNLLLVFVSSELHYIANTSSFSETIENGEFKRIQEVVQADQDSNGHLFAAELKRIMFFYTERFLKMVKMYNYILNHLQYEEEHEILMEIETPTFPIRLQEAQLFENQNLE